MSGARTPPSVPLEERRRVMTRVGHLVRRKQVEIERAVRLLRAHFVDQRPRAPRRGTLHQIVLVGPHAQRHTVPDRETGEINDYDLWAFVDHPVYRGMNRYWGLARSIVASSLRGRAIITLGVFTIDEIERLHTVGNRYFIDRYDRGIVLYDRDEGEQDVADA
jgi:hypothetical protein